MNNAATYSNPRFAIACALKSICRSEQTEDHVFAHLCERPDYADGRYSQELVDSVIDAMLDAGELRSSVIEAGTEYHATLIAI
jgi:hypothetical protein